VYNYGADNEILPKITSANIAAGFHASDPVTLQKTVEKAIYYKVRLGAHIGYPDRLGFGRRSMNITSEEAYAYTIYQLGAVAAFVKVKGGKLSHVKLHGAMYMDACNSPSLAAGVVKAVSDYDPQLLIYTLPNSSVENVAKSMGVNVWREFFADRPYADTEVQMFGWRLEDIGSPSDAAKRTMKHLEEPSGSIYETVCIHSDTPGAPKILDAVREALLEKYSLLKT